MVVTASPQSGNRDERWNYAEHPGDSHARQEGGAWTTCCGECAGTGVFPVPWIRSVPEGRADPDASCVRCKASGRTVAAVAADQPAGPPWIGGDHDTDRPGYDTDHHGTREGGEANDVPFHCLNCDTASDPDSRRVHPAARCPWKPVPSAGQDTERLRDEGRCPATECWYTLPVIDGLIVPHSKAGTLDVCEGGGRPPGPSQGQLLGAVIGSLLDTYKPEGVGIWLNSRNRNLGGRPLDLIAAGDAALVLAEADRLAGGPVR